MLDFINNLPPIIQSTISLMLTGIILWCLKTLPIIIYQKIVNNFTTRITISNYNQSFYNFLEWFENSNYKKFSRSLQITNGKWGYSSEPTLSAGIGIHFFKFENKWALVSLTRYSNSQSEKMQEEVSIRFLGFSQTFGSNLLKMIEPKRESYPNEYSVTLYRDGMWKFVGREYKRDFNTIFIKEDIKDKLFNTIDKFLNSKEEYIKKGIPYRLVIMLHGPPGTGKTSIIRALASKYSKDIAVASECGPREIQVALKTANNDSFLVLEDVDSLNGFKTRDEADGNNIKEIINNVSAVLNALDGIGGINNSIVILTTNHLEKIDSAILRPGRTDLILEIPKLKAGDLPKELNLPEDKKELTGAELQQYLRDLK